MVALMLWWPKCMEICLFRGGLSSKIAPAAPCFCFLNRGPGPFKAASEGPQTERSTPHRPGGYSVDCGYDGTETWEEGSSDERAGRTAAPAGQGRGHLD